MELMDYYFKTSPSEWGYMQQMWDLWIIGNPRTEQDTSKWLTASGLDMIHSLLN